MNYRFSAILASTAFILLTAVSVADAQNTEGQQVSYAELVAASKLVPAGERIAYGTESLQFGELRMPSSASRVPLIVFLHGGCWLSAYDLAHTRAFSAALVNAGYAVWSPEYRRVGDSTGGWLGTFDDVAQAVDFVPELVKGHARIDTLRVVLMGHSAGGQLALWAASRPARSDGKTSVPVRGVVSLAGVTDLAQYGVARGSCNSAVHRLMGGSALERPERYNAVDPMRRTPVNVPVRIVHGAQDAIVPLEQSTSFVAKNNAAGGTSSVDVVSGAAHFDMVAPDGPAFAAVLRALRALIGQTGP